MEIGFVEIRRVEFVFVFLKVRELNILCKVFDCFFKINLIVVWLGE